MFNLQDMTALVSYSSYEADPKAVKMAYERSPFLVDFKALFADF